ncbi:serine/threonine-protein kinase [Anabaena cylindrica UHCC 0172]|uniref:serine/threonine protein kinase n=1 Tax=Anabaena cylindrica TaxID=1165 RepID=UPI002B1F6540|nr:serine/threonine-protein kinase [Anabaena cylindrica]MEA5550060.1 serine/threonine-protein kinase [Anabaena cylindrica UHCC 0172]
MNTLHNCGDVIAGRYQIRHVLGHGGMGITYAAFDLQTNQLVAIKVLSLHRIKDWKVLELFEREAKILANLNHPGIPQYLNYFEIETDGDRAFYLVQELAVGQSLFELVNQGWKPSVDQVQAIAAQVLEILVYLQQLTPPVIHRDIKPQNLIRQENGQIFLVDFGAVQDTYHNTVTGGSTVVGTFGYMAPEQFRGQAVLSTDLYGLGTTLLFLLTGKSSADLPHHQLTIDFHSVVQLPKNFAAWLERMIEPISTVRFPSASEALVVLQGKQPLPPRATTYKKPKQSKIQLITTTDKMIVDIPSSLLNSPQSLWLGLSPMFGCVFIFWIVNAFIVEVLEPKYDFYFGGELIFRLVILIGFVPLALGIYLNAAQSLLFSSAFRTRIEIQPCWRIQKIYSLGFFTLQLLPIRRNAKLQASLIPMQHQFLIVKNLNSFFTLAIASTNIKLGLFLSDHEKAWLVNEINAFAERHNYE